MLPLYCVCNKKAGLRSGTGSTSGMLQMAPAAAAVLMLHHQCRSTSTSTSSRGCAWVPSDESAQELLILSMIWVQDEGENETMAEDKGEAVAQLLELQLAALQKRVEQSEQLEVIAQRTPDLQRLMLPPLLHTTTSGASCLPDYRSSLPRQACTLKGSLLYTDVRLTRQCIEVMLYLVAFTTLLVLDAQYGGPCCAAAAFHDFGSLCS